MYLYLMQFWCWEIAALARIWVTLRKIFACWKQEWKSRRCCLCSEIFMWYCRDKRDFINNSGVWLWYAIAPRQVMVLVFWMDGALWPPTHWRSGQTITFALSGLKLSQVFSWRQGLRSVTPFSTPKSQHGISDTKRFTCEKDHGSMGWRESCAWVSAAPF